MKGSASAFAMVILLSACSSGVGISRERAIELASPGGGPNAHVLSAESGPFGRFADAGTLPEEPRTRQVWAVVLAGKFPAPCVLNATGQSVCPPDAETMLVVLDFRTGDFLFGTTPAQ
jgi:hypothetical protein